MPLDNLLAQCKMAFCLYKREQFIALLLLLTDLKLSKRCPTLLPKCLKHFMGSLKISVFLRKSSVRFVANWKLTRHLTCQPQQREQQQEPFHVDDVHFHDRCFVDVLTLPHCLS